ncbi:MAG: oxidoreductase family protein [Psychromonas sp.]
MGGSLEQAELAIRQIAEFHSIWWESPEFTEMKWMHQWDKVQFLQHKEMFQLGWNPFLEIMGHKVPDNILQLGNRLGKHLVSVMSHVQEPPRTIAHFDYQLGNLFIAPSGSNTPLVVVDWQLLTFGRGTFDVAFFLGGNINSKDRSSKELDLLRIYHTTFIENGVRDYSFDQCLYDYRLSMLYCLARFVIVVGAIGVASEQERIYCETIVPRYIAAVVTLILKNYSRIDGCGYQTIKMVRHPNLWTEFTFLSPLLSLCFYLCGEDKHTVQSFEHRRQCSERQSREIILDECPCHI